MAGQHRRRELIRQVKTDMRRLGLNPIVWSVTLERLQLPPQPRGAARRDHH